MLSDPTTVLLIVTGVLFAGVSKGGFGSGAAFAATPLIAMAVDPGLALGVMLPLLMLMDVAGLKAYWKQWHALSAKALILGGIPGVALGALLWQVANADVFRLLIGAVAIGFVVYQLLREAGLLKIPTRPFAWGPGLLTGVAGGFTSFISHAGGPPVAVFLLAQGMGKTAFQATTVVTFWAINIFKFIPYAALGIFTQETLTVNVVMAPVALLGVWLGIKAHRMVPERLFFRITYVLLTVTGSKLIWDAFT